MSTFSKSETNDDDARKCAIELIEDVLLQRVLSTPTRRAESRITFSGPSEPSEAIVEPQEAIASESKLPRTSAVDVESLTLIEDREATRREVQEKKKQRVLGSVISIRRGDQTFFDRQKVPKFENSYKLDSDKPFNAEKVRNILKDVLEQALDELAYDKDAVPKKAKWASSAIRARVKEQEYDRYKIICYVTIGEGLCQDILTVVRFLWDAERDAYASYVHENLQLFAIALCIGIYYE